MSHPTLATDEQLCQLLKVDRDQVGRWKQRKGFEPVGDFSDRGKNIPLYSVAQAKAQMRKDKASG